MPLFSIIIPVKPDGDVTALAALRDLDYPPDTFEILIAEGSMPSRQRNLAARQAQGKLLYFLDDDSRPVADALRRCETAFGARDVAVVGGPSLTPASDLLLQRLIGAILGSPLGAGGVRNRYRAAGVMRFSSQKELILCNLALRRDIFLAFGGFDERLYPNEENELLDRIAGAGYRMLHDPGLAVERSQRSTIAAFMRQMYGYGRGRAQQTLLAGPRSLTSFAPLLFVCYLALLPLLPWWPGSAPLLLYVALALLSAVAAAVHMARPEYLLVLPLFPLMHCCNGLGLLAGFAGGRPKAGCQGDVRIRVAKSFEQKNW